MERRAIFIFIIVLVSSVISFSIDEKGIAMLNKAKGMIDYGVEIGEDSLLKDAIRILNEFIVLYPREHKEIREAYLMIGDAYYAMKQFSNAVDYYDKAIKTYPMKDDRYHYAVYSMAFSYYKMGKYDKAMEMFKALYGTEYEGEARVNVGSILIEMGDFKKAISELSKVSSKDWKPYASYYLGVAYERIGLISEAVMEFKESAKTSKDDDLTISSLYKAVEILLTVGKLNEAYDVSKELFNRYGQGKSGRSFEIALLHSEVLYRMRLYTQGLTTLQFELKRMVEEKKLNNIVFLGRYPEKEMSKLFALADVLLVHLNDNPLFQITIPHKILSYLAVGKPIIAALDGDGAEVVINAKASKMTKPSCIPKGNKRLPWLHATVKDNRLKA